jgi:nicotinamide-nucleotide amidase
MSFDRTLILEAKDVLDVCRSGGLRLATAESCTGGLIAAVLTSIAGSSAVFERGFVTYSNEAKTELLGVPAGLIAEHGAVSEPVARAMAEGALLRSHADIAVSVTGIAGPDGGSAEKPVGLVHFACARRDNATEHVRMQYGQRERHEIMQASVLQAFTMIRRQAAQGTALA